jgi:hypothetical protein
MSTDEITDESGTIIADTVAGILKKKKTIKRYQRNNFFYHVRKCVQ